MPELPEVETIRRGLLSQILDKKIERVEVRLPKMVSIGSATVSNIRKHSPAKAKKFSQTIKGQKFLDVNRRAKLLMLDLSGSYTMLVHLKMSGQFIFAKKNELPKKTKIFNGSRFEALELPHKHTHVIFHFQNGDKLYYNDLRQFGYLRLINDEDIARVKELSEFGPEPFAKDFTLKYLTDKAKPRKISIKQVLMDPKVVTGIGNIYSDEILYCAGVKPQRKASNVKAKELEKIYKCTALVLRQALKKKGSSVGDFFKVDGSEGSFGKLHKVYGRARKKCRKCGRIVKKVKLGGRTSSFCPYCQK